ncbi:MAG TPA: hypothetical protein VN539_05910 [Candidatus Saccharimonadales bacterium]|nr:hypothetical protein [Candidatus Saccharimonadales bacterium]
MSRLSLLMAYLVMALSLTLSIGKASAADVSINLRIGDPYRGPRLVFHDEPDVVVVPGTRVYYVRDYDYDIYRYGSYWYYTYDGGWYRARRYNGPFTYVGYNSVPRAVTYVPVRYRRHWRDNGPPHGRAYGHTKVKVKEDRGWHGQGNNGRDDNGHGNNGRGHGKH